MEIILTAVLLGLVCGSFLNVVVVRLPVMMERAWTRFSKEHLNLPLSEEETREFNLCRPASHCPNCRTPVPRRYNIPLLGFALARGRCTACRARISRRYPVLEALTAVLFGIMAWRYGATWLGVSGCLFTAFLLAAAWIDAETQYLPDQLTLPLLWLGLIFNFSDGLVPLHEAVAGAAAGYLSLRLLNEAHKLLRGTDGMGGGDFKLFAALGAWLGIFALPLAAFAAALCGIVLALVLRAKRGQAVPFGPSLALSGWLLFAFYGNILPLFYRFLNVG
ncbi:MAG: A24 family peptidase [Neisseria sp.]|nr:A24 family peptidase [Neisseria sp.]